MKAYSGPNYIGLLDILLISDGILNFCGMVNLDRRLFDAITCSLPGNRLPLNTSRTHDSAEKKVIAALCIVILTIEPIGFCGCEPGYLSYPT